MSFHLCCVTFRINQCVCVCVCMYVYVKDWIKTYNHVNHEEYNALEYWYVTLKIKKYSRKIIQVLGRCDLDKRLKHSPTSHTHTNASTHTHVHSTTHQSGCFWRSLMCTGCGDLMLRTKQTVCLSLHQTFLQLKAHSGPALSNVRIPQIWSQRFLGVN